MIAPLSALSKRFRPLSGLFGGGLRDLRHNTGDFSMVDVRLRTLRKLGWRPRHTQTRARAGGRDNLRGVICADRRPAIARRRRYQVGRVLGVSSVGKLNGEDADFASAAARCGTGCASTPRASWHCTYSRTSAAVHANTRAYSHVGKPAEYPPRRMLRAKRFGASISLQEAILLKAPSLAERGVRYVATAGLVPPRLKSSGLLDISDSKKISIGQRNGSNVPTGPRSAIAKTIDYKSGCHAPS
jgi:hypothetical protein